MRVRQTPHVRLFDFFLKPEAIKIRKGKNEDGQTPKTPENTGKKAMPGNRGVKIPKKLSEKKSNKRTNST